MGKLGNESAFPQVETRNGGYREESWGDTFSIGGLTKREFFAAMAMQGLIGRMLDPGSAKAIIDANNGKSAGTIDLIATCSLEAADALLAGLEKPNA